MYILCDTCSILMLIRIVPEMFTDKIFECCTISEVRDELFQTQKFKEKYPWRIKFKNSIIKTNISKDLLKDFSLHYNTIKNIISHGAINSKTKKLFNLSLTDQKLVSFALSTNLKIATEDTGIVDFAEQQFSKQSISALGLLNYWIEKKLVVWSDNMQIIIENWDKCNEKPQSKNEIKKFEKLTGYKYTGP